MRSLPPSIVWLEKTLQLMEVESNRYRMIYIKGKPLSGKSILLQQIALRAAERGQSITTVSISQNIDLPFALQQIGIALGLKISNVDEAKVSDLIDEIIQVADKPLQLLVIDNLGKIRNGHRFIEAVVRQMVEGTVIASGELLPEIDPSLALDLYIFRYSGLSHEESDDLVKKSRVELPADSIKALDLIFDVTSGNPFFIKMLLSAAVLEGRPLEMSDIQAQRLSVRELYLNRILKSLDQTAQRQLILSSFIEFDSVMEGKVLGSLPQDVVRLLLDVGFISPSFEFFLLNSEVRTLLKKNYADQEHDSRRSLLTLYSRPTTYFASKEKLSQLVALQELSEALRSFEDLASEMDRLGDPLDLIRLSNSLLPKLSVDSLLLRRKALVYLKKPQQALSEIKSANERDFSLEDKLRLWFAAAKTNYYLAEFDDALEYIDAILDKSPISARITIETQIEKAYMLHNQKPDLSFELLNSAYENLKVYHPDDALLWGDLEFIYGIYFEFLGSLGKALKHYSDAVQRYRDANLKSKELLASYNAFCMRYYTGQDCSLDSLTAIEDESKRYFLNYIVDICSHFRASRLVNSGQVQAGIKLLEENLPPLSRPTFTLTELRVLKKLTQAYCEISSYHQALSILDRICDLEVGVLGRDDKEFFIKMHHCIQVYLSGEKRNRYSFSRDSTETPFLLNKNMTTKVAILELKLNLNSFLPFDLSSFLEATESPEGEIDAVALLQLYCLRGIHFFFSGHIKKAERELNRSLPMAKKYSYSYWEFLNLLGLAMVDLQAHRFDLALAKSTRAVELKSSFDPLPMVDLASIIQAISFLKVGRQSDFENTILSINTKSSFAYIAYVLSSFLLKSLPLSAPVVTAVQKNFFDLLLARLGLDIVRTVRIKTHQSETLSYEHQLPDFPPTDFDIVIHDLKNKWRVGRKWYPLKAQPLLDSILRYLLSAAGQDVTKEMLVTNIWREKYNPLVHDTRIYTAVKRLREMLRAGLKRSVLQTRENIYLIDPKIRYVIVGLSSPLDSLSSRQQWILKFMEGRRQINRLLIQKMLKISTAYAKKEIKALVDRGLIEKIGKGRTSEYQRPASP